MSPRPLVLLGAFTLTNTFLRSFLGVQDRAFVLLGVCVAAFAVLAVAARCFGSFEPKALYEVSVPVLIAGTMFVLVAMLERRFHAVFHLYRGGVLRYLLSIRRERPVAVRHHPSGPDEWFAFGVAPVAGRGTALSFRSRGDGPHRRFGGRASGALHAACVRPRLRDHMGGDAPSRYRGGSFGLGRRGA